MSHIPNNTLILINFQVINVISCTTQQALLEVFDRAKVSSSGREDSDNRKAILEEVAELEAKKELLKVSLMCFFNAP